MIALAPPKRRLLAAGRIQPRREPLWPWALYGVVSLVVWALALAGAWCLLRHG